MIRNLLAVSTIAVLTACATASAPGGATTGPSGMTLAYAAAAPVSGTYEFSDSSAFTIQGGAIGDIRATTRGAGTVNATYTQKGTDVEVRLQVTDFAGSFTNSAMGGTTNATEADVPGEAVLTLTPRGEVTINSLPTATRAAQQIGMSSAFFRRFAIRLPGGRVQRGSSWTDTLRTSEDASGVKSTVHDVVTSTWARDTTVAGRTLNVITHSTQRQLDVAGSSEGVEIRQKLSGTSTGHSLWDPQRNVVVERFETTSLSGTFDLPAMGLTGLPVTANGAGRLTLR